jgi:fermentation-respiration switch protein FrsA (DUF1100 family)
VLQSGFASLNRIATEIFPVLAIYPGSLLSDPPLDNLSLMQKPHAPLLVVHGAQDDVVPFDHGKCVFAAAAEPKQFAEFPECGHDDISRSNPGRYRRVLSEFFQSIGRRQQFANEPTAEQPAANGG